MDNRHSIKLRNSGHSTLRIVIEPWANEWDLPVGSVGEVVSVGGEGKPVIDLDVMANGRIVFWVETAGSVYEYWQDGQLID